MPMRLTEDEPNAGPWRVAPLSELGSVLLDGGPHVGRPRIIAVDGRSGSGNDAHRAGADCRARCTIQGTGTVYPSRADWGNSVIGSALFT
jgi:hypothetical protein